MVLKKNNPPYVTAITGKGKFEVLHLENGTLLDDIDSMFAATAIAQLACLGNISRNAFGELVIEPHNGHDDLESMDDYVAGLDAEAADDAPEDEDENVELCPPRDELECTNEKT